MFHGFIIDFFLSIWVPGLRWSALFIHLSAHLVWQKVYCWTLYVSCAAKFYQTFHAYMHHWPQLFYTTFNGLDLGFLLILQTINTTELASLIPGLWESQGFCGLFFFFVRFSVDLDKIWYAVETFRFVETQLFSVTGLLIIMCVRQGRQSYSWDFIKENKLPKNHKPEMFVFVQLFMFKLCMVIVNIKLNSLVSFWMALTEGLWLWWQSVLWFCFESASEKKLFWMFSTS